MVTSDREWSSEMPEIVVQFTPDEIADILAKHAEVLVGKDGYTVRSTDVVLTVDTDNRSVSGQARVRNVNPR